MLCAAGRQDGSLTLPTQRSVKLSRVLLVEHHDERCSRGQANDWSWCHPRGVLDIAAIGVLCTQARCVVAGAVASVSVEDHKSVVRRFYEEVAGQGKLDLLDVIASEDMTDTSEWLWGSARADRDSGDT